MKQDWLDWAERNAPIDDAEVAHLLGVISQAFTDASLETVIHITTRIGVLPEIFRMIRAVDTGGGMTGEVRAFFEDAPHDKRAGFMRLMETLLPDEPDDTPAPGM